MKHTLHTTVIFGMILTVFGESVSENMLIFGVGNVGVVYWLGDIDRIQNNYVVHFLTICYQPFFLAASLKYQLFK